MALKSLLLTTGILLDGLGISNVALSVFGIGIPFSGILDFMGLTIFGTCLFFQGDIGTVSQKILPRFFGAAISESIPIWSDICPSWTLLALSL